MATACGLLIYGLSTSPRRNIPEGPPVLLLAIGTVSGTMIGVICFVAIKGVLHYGGYKVIGSVVKPGTKSAGGISERLHGKARKLSERLTQ